MDDQKAYTTGLELDLPDTFLGQVFYWRVRGLDLKGRPVSEFSDIEEAHVDIFQPFTEKPTPLSFFNQGPGQTIQGAARNRTSRRRPWLYRFLRNRT